MVGTMKAISRAAVRLSAMVAVKPDCASAKPPFSPSAISR